MQNRERKADDRAAGTTRPKRIPLRRATDPTMLLGDARPLTVGAAVAAMAGCILAALGVLTPLAFVLSSVVAVGLLTGARRVDILMRPDFAPDRSTRSRRAVAIILVLVVVGTAWSAWTLALEWSR